MPFLSVNDPATVRTIDGGVPDEQYTAGARVGIRLGAVVLLVLRAAAVT